MRNKKKRATTIDRVRHNLASKLETMEMLIGESRNQCCIEPAEIKQEFVVKEEPGDVLLEIPVVDDGGVGSLTDFNECGEYDFTHLNTDMVKTEVKTEIDGKKEEDQKKSANSAEDHDNVEHSQMQRPQDEHNRTSMEIVDSVNDTKRRNAVVNQRSKSKKHKCDVCEYSSEYKSDLNRHLLKHTGEKPFGCDYCPKRFTSKQNLCSHQKVHVEEFLFHCDVCLEGFNIKDGKIEHETGCKAIRYACHLCQQSFGSEKNNLIRHMRVHTGVKPYKCQQCLKEFNLKHNLNVHMKFHTKKLPFKCSICRHGFSKQSQCKAHEKYCYRRCYECHRCRKFFQSKKADLEIHIRTHSGEKPFQCKLCRIGFAAKSNLTRHMKSRTHLKKS